jgi:hypothetical protein
MVASSGNLQVQKCVKFTMWNYWNIPLPYMLIKIVVDKIFDTGYCAVAFAHSLDFHIENRYLFSLAKIKHFTLVFLLSLK